MFTLPRPPLLLALFAAANLVACQAGVTDNVVVHVSPADAAVFAAYLNGVPGAPALVVADEPGSSASAATWTGVLYEEPEDPGASPTAPWLEPEPNLPDMHVAVVRDLTCGECYELSGAGHVWTVHAGDLLSAQYGLTHILELWGYRFFSPFAGHKPEALATIDETPVLGVRQSADTARRGLHLHTLHPIEGLDAFWVPGAHSRERAAAIIDWAIKSRANHLQWVALDDIQSSEATAAAWQDHTRLVNTMAHDRGLTTGLGIQLFGKSNLQQAFDLVDGNVVESEMRGVIEERLAVVTGDVGFDEFNLSFGEFFNADAEAFVRSVDLVWDVAREQQPGVSMTTVIHVGDGEDQKVEYQGQEMIYYFLAAFADPEIVPWVHTTMAYNLFEDAGGAYHHEEFDAHREFLLDRLNAGQPVGYFPETAYWVAFDNSVPIYMPLYMRSRWLDLDRVQAETGAPLPDQTLFSTGWEWGFWQNDYAALRMAWRLRAWEDEVADLYAPWGEDGDTLGRLIVGVAEAQHTALIEERLTPYVSARDASMDLGYNIGVVAAPERPTFSDVADWTPEERSDFSDDVLEPLLALAETLDGYGDTARTLAANGDPWFVEMADAMQVTHQRVRFVHALWSAAIEGASGSDPGPWLEAAAVHQDRGGQLIDDRHDSLHDPDRVRMVAAEWENPTIYDYGYLHHAETQCFWEKERVEVERALGRSDDVAPPCTL
jgi:hypothetical protein